MLLHTQQEVEASIYERATKCLENSDEVFGRDAEIANLCAFVNDAINTGGSIYISGIPGVGKSATVTFALNLIRRQRFTLNLSTLKGTTLRESLMDELKGRSARNCRTLEDFFKEPIVVVLEEVDTSRFAEEVVWFYQISKVTKLILIGIGNSATFTLADEAKRMQFSAYDKDVFQEIIGKKMESVKRLFDSKCALLWASRVSVASGGDFRVAKRLMLQCISEAKLAKSVITLSMIQRVFTEYLKSTQAQPSGAPPAAIEFLDMIKKSGKKMITVSDGRSIYQETTKTRVEPHIIRSLLQTLCDVNCLKMVSKTPHDTYCVC